MKLLTYQPKIALWQFVIGLCFVFLASASTGYAQLESSELKKQIKALEQISAPSEDEQQILKLYQQAAQLADSTKSNNKTIQKYKLAIKEAPASLESLRKSPTTPELPKSDASTPLKTLEQELSNINAELEANRQGSRELDTTIKQRSVRLNDIPGELATIRQSLSRLSNRPPITTGSQLDLAKQEVLLQKRSNYSSSITLLETEQELYTTETSLNVAKKQATQSLIEALSAAQTKWQDLIQQHRDADAKLILQDAEHLATLFTDIPELNSIARSNLKLVHELTGDTSIRARINEVDQFRNQLEDQMLRVRDQRNNAERRIALLEEAQLEIDTETGALLRQNRAHIPNTDSLKVSLRHYLQESAKAQMERESLSSMNTSDLDQQVESLYATYQNQGITKADLFKLLDQRRKLIDSLTNDYLQYDLSLRNTNEITREAISIFSSYSHFLDSRLLWIASAPPLSIQDFKSEILSIVSLFSAATIGQWLKDMLADIMKNWWLWLPVTVILAGLTQAKARFRNTLIALGETAELRNCSSFIPTLRALLLTLLISSPFPLLILFLACRTDSTSVFYSALMNVALFSGLVGILRRTARPNGILESHIKLDSQRTKLLYLHLSWYLPLMLPFVFLTPALTELNEAQASGRIIYIIALLITTTLLYILSKPSNQLFYDADEPTRFSKVLHALCILTPIALITGSALGYFTSVRIIHQQVISSVFLILSSLFLVALLLRWGLVSRRKLAIQQALRRREAALAERKRKEDSEETIDGGSHIPTQEEVQAEALRVTKVQGKTTHLVKVSAICAITFGLWGIWSTSLPALSVLDSISLWGGTPAAAAESSSPSAPTIPGFPKSKSESSTPAEAETATATDGAVTLQDLLVFFIILFLTYTAARNIPSLIELIILGKINLKPGGAFAVTTSVTYSIVVVGIIIAFAKIGITWQKVQWIAAAVTLGIGFGLQEVFANFVAGLILLFERPIRLGDFITVGEVSGRVTEIRIRATTIQQLNNRELVVPNKEFITGQLVNWTLKDALLRVDVPVGIAYGSDTDLAKQELLKVAKANHRVLTTPAPEVCFDAFGESTLNLILRCHVNGIDDFGPVQSEMRFAINKAFHDAHIEIAFPQRDIHIRSITTSSGDQKALTIPIPQPETDRK